MIFNSATTPNSGGYIEGFNGDGFTAAAVIYAVFSVASWLSPSIVTWKGNQISRSMNVLIYWLRMFDHIMLIIYQALKLVFIF